MTSKTINITVFAAVFATAVVICLSFYCAFKCMSRPLRRLSPPQNQAQAVQQQHGQLANDEELAEELEGGNGQRGYPMQDLPPRYEEPPPEYEDPPPYAP